MSLLGLLAGAALLGLAADSTSTSSTSTASKSKPSSPPVYPPLPEGFYDTTKKANLENPEITFYRCGYMLANATEAEEAEEILDGYVRSLKRQGFSIKKIGESVNGLEGHVKYHVKYDDTHMADFCVDVVRSSYRQARIGIAVLEKNMLLPDFPDTEEFGYSDDTYEQNMELEARGMEPICIKSGVKKVGMDNVDDASDLFVEYLKKLRELGFSLKEDVAKDDGVIKQVNLSYADKEFGLLILKGTYIVGSNTKVLMHISIYKKPNFKQLFITK